MENQRLTLVFTDSRGKCLDAYLENPEIKVKYFKGLGLLDIIELADGYIQVHRPTCVLFVGGICDFSNKCRRSGKISLKYHDYYFLFNHISDIFKTAREITDHRYPDIRIGFGGLCGFNINQYNREIGFSPYQRLIDHVISDKNRQILEDNIQHQIVHPTLTSKLHRRSRKYGFRNQYRLLYDGLHLSNILNEDWARNIERYHRNNHTAV